MKHIAILLGAAITLAGCATDGATVPVGRAPIVPIPRGGALLDRVVGQSAAGLTGLFGAPVADIREGNGRKLQFGNATCVLDAYLYPQQGRGEPVVTYVDARQTDGSPVDRASCVSALQLARRR